MSLSEVFGNHILRDHIILIADFSSFFWLNNIGISICLQEILYRSGSNHKCTTCHFSKASSSLCWLHQTLLDCSGPKWYEGVFKKKKNPTKIWWTITLPQKPFYFLRSGSILSGMHAGILQLKNGAVFSLRWTNYVKSHNPMSAAVVTSNRPADDGRCNWSFRTSRKMDIIISQQPQWCLQISCFVHSNVQSPKLLNLQWHKSISSHLRSWNPACLPIW